MSLASSENRKIRFVCVQLPEKTYDLKDGQEKPRKESKVAYDKGYKTIAEISKERIRRAGAGIAQGLTPLGRVERAFAKGHAAGGGQQD